MNILVVVGYCMQVNSSANLCHLSYIKGLMDLGHKVDILTVSEKGQNVDSSIIIPNVNDIFYFKSSLYERLSYKKNLTDNSKRIVKTQKFDKKNYVSKKNNILKLINQSIKSFVHKLYGTYGTDIMWYHHAKKWRSTNEYDYIISLAYPPVSHKLVERLIKKKRVLCKKWIQVWEDPWYSDLYGFFHNDKVKKEEYRILSKADIVYYVSPLTLLYQKQLFHKFANKMKWQPLPCYYNSDKVDVSVSKKYIYGYFGDYAPKTRNITPFYKAAIKLGIEVNICGNPDNLLESTDKVHIYPRLPLYELKPIENSSNVLIFLCNLKGGQIPGKIYQYSATYKTILFILDGSEEEKKVLKEYFQQFNRYIFCDNTVDDISKAIDRIEGGNIGNVKNEPVEHFNPENIVKKILECK